MHSDESQWVQFFHRCQSSRLDVDIFSSYAKLLSSRISLPPNRIADVFLRPTEHNSISPDPRVTLYIQALQELNLINVPAVLRALLKYSTFQPPRHSDGANEGGMRLMKWENSYVSEEVILYSVARSVSSGATPKDAHEAVEIFKYLAGWMSVLLAVNAADDILQVMGSVGTQTVENLAVKTALGTVLVALADNPIATSALQKSCPKGTKADCPFQSLSCPLSIPQTCSFSEWYSRPSRCFEIIYTCAVFLYAIIDSEFLCKCRKTRAIPQSSFASTTACRSERTSSQCRN